MHGCLEVRRLCLLLALTALPGVVSAEANTYQERFAGLALACVHQEYPNKIAHVMSSD